MLLAIDTSAGTSVAVVDRDRGVLAERSSPDPRGHAELIGTFIDECLRESGIDRAELSGVVAGMGPGPFTGLRVGIVAARTFALGLGRPVVPILSHDAIAFGAEHDSPVIVVTDARRRELFWSAYSGRDAAALPVRTAGPALTPAAELDHLVAQHPGAVVLDGGLVSAAALGLLAEAMYSAGRPFAADEAVYLRSPDVTLSAGPKRVTA
jgi:tRNA threonylcarbamoyl adenosine modification protein YeaZ